MLSRQLPPYRESLAGRLLSAREAVMAPIRPILRTAGVTEQQWRVLRTLTDEGGIDVTTLAYNAMLRPPSLTRILKELTERKLVIREADAEDGRRSIVTISPAGRALVDETTAAYLATLDRYADTFGVDRFQALLDELAVLTDAIAGPEGIAAAD